MNIETIRARRIAILYWLVLLYDWVLAKAGHRYAVPFVMLIAFCESIFFPIPPDVMLLPMMLARPKHSFVIALGATIASVLGGALGYWLGFALYDSVAVPLLSFYGYEQAYQLFSNLFAQYGNFIVFAGGFSPIPYKVIVLSAGFAQMDFIIFMVISVLARGGRFFLLAVILWFFGAKIQELIEKYFGLLTVLFCALLVGGFFAIKLLH